LVLSNKLNWRKETKNCISFSWHLKWVAEDECSQTDYDSLAMERKQNMYRMPAEWEAQKRLWFSWPKAVHLWPNRLGKVQRELLRIIAMVSQSDEVGINGLNREKAVSVEIEHEVNWDCVLFSNIPNDDAWCRDHGPTFVEELENKKIGGIDWNFNAWGDKYRPWTEDNKVASRMLEQLECERIECPFVGEGGGLEVDGDGSVLLTESVWLNPNRNAGLKKPEIEAWLLKHLGCEQALWFTEGMEEDDTDGHVDMFARFVQKDAILYCACKQPSHPQYRALQQIKEQLNGFRTLTRGHFDTIQLPIPDPVILNGEICPASYGNFLIYNDFVFVPQYGQERNDAYALGVIGECFPNHRIEGVDCADFITEGGAIHCLTQQQPVEPVSSEDGLDVDQVGGTDDPWKSLIL
jgi:agmatine deiminase